MQTVEELISILTLEKIEDNIFRGETYKTPWKRVYGGQVLGQSLQAAMATIGEEKFLHSMHAYFILTGDIEREVVYIVDNIRDGGSFSTRRVRAVQHGRDIFIMSASFHKDQPGMDHQDEMPDVPKPGSLKTDIEQAEVFKDILPSIYRQLTLPRPVEFRPVEAFPELYSGKHAPHRHVWMKAKSNLGNVPPSLHKAALAYASDYNLLTTALIPHVGKINFKNLQMASLDHAMWFHRPFRMDEWLLYAFDSPSASGARGFTRGRVFNEDGILVASIVQEGLLRERKS
ncbi:MAG: acyl-CoA thioesterase II [Bacteroidia bacterium]|nr:acyl-CoA thioesterase II [Bacteroidia bacterium]